MERAGRLFREFRNGKLLRPDSAVFFLHFGKIDQVRRELGKPVRLFADIRNPLAFFFQL